ncbi:MAG: glycosyltransferase family 2 protein [Rhizobiales bacterium]|nr:glycosyltransferase family 2 protein [Hyphomicrobiales bacterium]
MLERFRDPSSILTFISNVAPRARAIIITTPDRDVVRGLDHGSQKDPSRVHAWNSAEFERLLHARHLHPTFLGLTGGNILNPVRDTILAVLDRYSVEAAPPVPDDFHPLAIIATYNDRDFVLQVVGDLLEDGIDVHVLDNWSTDDTFEQLRGLASSSGGLKLERFPATGPTRYFEWHAILERKEEIAAQFPNRWVMHQDSDELRRSPWPDISMRAGLHIAERMGFNAIDFTVCDFRPIDDSFTAGMKPETAFRFFEFGRRPGQFLQVKAWRQGTERIELATSGGHQAEFPGRRIFPYNFLLKHYQFRSPTHARQKVLERRTRFSPHERANGWHTHYDNFTNNHPFLWRPSELIEFDEKETRRRFLTKLIAGIDIAR